MLKFDYIKEVITKADVTADKAWYVKAFTLPLWKDEDYSELGEYDLVITKEGLSTLLKGEDGELVLTRIIDHDRKEPLFSWQDKLTVDNSWLPNISGKIETVLGRLIVNKVVFADIVGDRIPYLNKPRFDVKDLEKIIASKTQDKKDMRKGDISVQEMTRCIDAINFFSFVATFTSVAATAKSISPPPDAKEFRDSLLKEFEGRLDDPVVISTIQQRIAEHEKEYLKDDPTAQALFDRKSRAARTKMYYFGGAGLDFVEGGDTTVVRALSEGTDTTPEELAKYMNDARYASFSRGGKTALGGYAYKTLQRSLSSIDIKPTPCNTTKGLVRKLGKKNINNLVGRQIKVGNRWKTIETQEEASKYIDKEVEVRSVMYCSTKGNDVCYACMSQTYQDQPNAISLIAADVSSVILGSALKLMHNSAIGTTEIDLDDMIN